MKKILLATSLLVALTTAAFADGTKAKMLSDLRAALNTNHVAWQTSSFYKKASFTFNGKNVSAFINAESEELIGFSFSINLTDLPEGALENIEKKYQGWTPIEAIMFVDADGNSNYFAQINKGKNSLALRVFLKGKVAIYSKIYK